MLRIQNRQNNLEREKKVTYYEVPDIKTYYEYTCYAIIVGINITNRIHTPEIEDNKYG